MEELGKKELRVTTEKGGEPKRSPPKIAPILPHKVTGNNSCLLTSVRKGYCYLRNTQQTNVSLQLPQVRTGDLHY